jgi:hypothetical protein
MWTGEVEHGDSIGNKGVIKSGSVQWMTAGSGIVHQEMPRKYDGLMQGFQLWVNLPAKKKMIDPKYRGIEREEIPIVNKNGMKIKVIAGSVDGTEGPSEVMASGSERPAWNHEALISPLDGAGFKAPRLLRRKISMLAAARRFPAGTSGAAWSCPQTNDRIFSEEKPATGCN